jgi:peptidoglycan/xylan/chitin deacetylase (PgdA/CDA1 family)
VALKRSTTLVDRLMTPKQGLVVLAYHRVGGGSGSEVDLDPAVFDDQLAYLAEHHRVLTLDDAVAGLAGGESLDGAVVLTFDDGTPDWADVVVPALVRHRLPATCYVATRFVDAGEAFPWGAPPISWSGLADCAATGLVQVESHGHGHLLLDRLSPAEVADDLDRSIELIGERLGRAPQHFAYPKAVPPSAPAEVQVRRRFRSAALGAGRVNRPDGFDPHRLWRTSVQVSDTPEWFRAKAAGGMRLEGELRHLVARVRYRGRQ